MQHGQLRREEALIDLSAQACTCAHAPQWLADPVRRRSNY
jgi:hypothetical protein